MPEADEVLPVSSMVIPVWMVPSVRSLQLLATTAPLVSLYGVDFLDMKSFGPELASLNQAL